MTSLVQLLGLRTFTKAGKPITVDAFFKDNWRAPSVPELLRRWEHYLEQVPAERRWNIFYTVPQCADGKREFERQTVLAFDIDGVAEEKRATTADLVADVLGVARDTSAVVSSGNGVHVIFELADVIDRDSFFKEAKAAYDEVCRLIDASLQTAGIAGHADPVIFEPRRFLRMPGTENRKAGKETKHCRLIRQGLRPVKINLMAFNPVGAIPPGGALPQHIHRRYGETDTEAVLAGCAFLTHCEQQAAKISEPEWYAALSITARLSPAADGRDARAISHELSAAHPGYDLEETDRKIAQAMAASGPRTCAGIDALWRGCRTCAHYDKVTSPIQIVSPDKIPTEMTGFHWINEKGKATPAPEDLRRYLEREQAYRIVEKTRAIYTWNGKHYEEHGDNWLEEFAHTHYLPKPAYITMSGFRKLVTGTRIKPVRWFEDTTHGLLALENGVLDVKTGEFFEHSPERGFRAIVPYAYDPQATAPVFGKMLRLVTGGDPELQAILLEAMGYCLSGDKIWIHKAIVLEGEGSNGKSTFIEILQMLAGANGFSCCSVKDLKDEYVRAIFDGKLFNVSDETPTKAMLDASFFKSMSSGAGVNARHPYAPAFTLRNSAKFVFSCNELPRTDDLSYGFFRRLLIVPFRQRITASTPGYDPKILDKIALELPGILNLALEGYRRLARQRAFSEADAATASITAYEVDSNSVRSWFLDEVVELANGHAKAFTPYQNLYASYRQLTRSRELLPLNFHKFMRELRRIYPALDERSIKQRYPDGVPRSQSRLLHGIVGVGLIQDHGDADEFTLPPAARDKALALPPVPDPL